MYLFKKFTHSQILMYQRKMFSHIHTWFSILWTQIYFIILHVFVGLLLYFFIYTKNAQ